MARPRQALARAASTAIRERPASVEPTATRGSDSSISVRGLAKAFRNGRAVVQAVRDIDFTIERGETVAILGPNGAGKSTTIEMVLGLIPPDGGSVSVFGLEPQAAVQTGLVGAMLQSGGLIRDLSVTELVTVIASLYPHPLPVEQVLRMAGLQAAAGQRTEKLSGGQTQRARLAVALVGDPDLMILDEPTAAMDVEARRSFWRTMAEYTGRGKTLIFATHYLEEADANADRVILMAGGRVVADGSTTEVKAMVGARTIRARIPGAGQDVLLGLPGVTAVDEQAGVMVLTCSDSDAALRALIERYPAASQIEVGGTPLEEAFLRLTGAGENEEAA